MKRFLHRAFLIIVTPLCIGIHVFYALHDVRFGRFWIARWRQAGTREFWEDLR